MKVFFRTLLPAAGTRRWRRVQSGRDATLELRPHGTQLTAEPAAGPCMHVAPLDSVRLGPKSEYRYRYWLLTGTEAELAATLEKLWAKYSREQAVLHPPDH
jgi:hypothetical protein